MSSRFSYLVRSYRRQLYRERRRLVLSSALFSLAIWIDPDRLPEPFSGPATALLLIAGLMICTPFVAMRFPKSRHMLEIVAVADLLFALTGWLLPTSAANFTQAHPDYLLGWALYSSMIILVYFTLYGRWSDRLPRPNVTMRVSHMRTKLDLPTLWYGLVPTPGYADRVPEPDVVAVEYASSDKRLIRLVTWRPDHQAGEVLMHIDDMDPFSYVRLRLRVVHGHHDPAIEGVTEFAIKDDGKYRTLEVRHEMAQLPLRRLLRGWIDDRLGQLMDARLAAVECRASRAKSNAIKSKYPLMDWQADASTTTCLTASGSNNPTGYRTAYGRSMSGSESTILTELSQPGAERNKQLA